MYSDFVLVRKILRLGNLIVNVRAEDLTDRGLTPVQSETLQYIEANSGCSISELRSFLGVSHQAACKIIDRLKARGLILVSPSELDGRSKKIELSAAGRAAHAALVSTGTDVGAAILSGFSPAEREQLNVFLEKMLAALEED